MALNKLIRYLGLDIGTRRIGVAYAEADVPIAIPLITLTVDGTETARLEQLITGKNVTDVVVGLPRNSRGETNAQTASVKDAVELLLKGQPVKLHFQDESLTSVIAEEQLKLQGKPYDKADIDMQAAIIILQDYLEL